MMALASRSADARPASATPPSELIAGNEFLKLFLERDELHSGEHEGTRGSVRHTAHANVDADVDVDMAENYRQNAAADQTTSPKGVLSNNRATLARNSSYNKSRNEKRNAPSDEGKQVVKLVTSGSKIVFLEEYDDNDAIVDAVARDIDLQKERVPQGKHGAAPPVPHYASAARKSKSNSDEVKVVAVSVSSSSKRASSQRERDRERDRSHVDMASMQRHKLAEPSKQHVSHATMQSDIMRQPPKPQQRASSTTKSPDMTLTTTPATMSASAATNIDFVNRSHKSEFSIEEAEPLTMSQQQQQQRYATRATARNTAMVAVAAAAALDDVDSENSASSNIQKVLAAPLVQSASTRSTVTAAAAYHGGNRNATSTSSHVNHQTSAVAHALDSADTAMPDTSAPASDVDDKLLPFQTVIYHDTKESHGPQSRSISYSSLSQNVEDLHAWRHSGILAEAQRNVSESLKPMGTHADMPTAPAAAGTGATPASSTHQSEAAKFYSVPAKMYSEPSKFYSEPAKVYSEPAKVYGQPEKFYSEPAKVYGQPSKFYSEPAKVYSQPSKVYGEPAKTYWPQSATATATATTTTPPTGSTTANPASAAKVATRRPAIVSRIAFGEAQTPTAMSIEYGDEAAHTTPVPTHGHNQKKQMQQQQQQPQQTNRQPTRFHSHAATHSQLPQAPSPSSSSSALSSQSQSQPRRVLFNLDKLPYDLLNAPVQSAQHLLDPDYTNSPPAAVTYSSPRQRQCLESAFSATRLSQSAAQRQHSSLSDEHSNQNAKGLPNRDLVKCVSKYNQPATPAAPHQITTESSHIDDLYTPTPEQNYEIEESVSVMTNGRAHGVQGIHGVPTPATATETITVTTTRKPAGMRGTKLPSRMRFGEATGIGIGVGGGAGRGRDSDSALQQQHHHQQLHPHQQRHHYHTNTNANVNDDGHNYDDVDGYDGADDANGDIGDGDVGDGDGNDKGAAAHDDSKVAYVVEGRNYRKYRVEEKTDDGFIVGEYGVVDHNDGNLRGVRYTADSTINRSLIQKALLTFLKLK